MAPPTNRHALPGDPPRYSSHQTNGPPGLTTPLARQDHLQASSRVFARDPWMFLSLNHFEECPHDGDSDRFAQLASPDSFTGFLNEHLEPSLMPHQNANPVLRCRLHEACRSNPRRSAPGLLSSSVHRSALTTVMTPVRGYTPLHAQASHLKKILGSTRVNQGTAVMMTSPTNRQIRYGTNGTIAFPMSISAKAQAM
jgi:hypothetical protein